MFRKNGYRLTMNDNHQKNDVLIIIGCLLLGIGAGLLFFPVSIFGAPSVFAFAGCIIAGLGLGLVLSGKR